MALLKNEGALNVVVLTMCFLFGFVSFAVAAGEGHHHHEESGHMKSMMAVKDKVPEEYKIMDRTPVVPTQASLNTGQALYQENCLVCHGREGKGNGPAASSLKNKPANFLDKDHSSIYGPGEKYWIITHGTETTGMPGFPQLQPQERWHLVNYILNLQK